jgi:hypothetical protein
MVEAVAEEKNKLQQARAKSCLAVETAAAVFVFEDTPPLYMRG